MTDRLTTKAIFAVACSVVLTFAFSLTHAQSGRQKPQPTAKATPSPTPRPRQSSSANSQNTSSQTKTAPPTEDEKNQNQSGGEGDDVVRVASNLVPIPASVVDASGRAVADLKPSDFELRVDGEKQQIADISRSELPVRLVMLFDNSSSLTEARDFERKAAIRFFKRVMRPVDQAAIFSVSTTPQLETNSTSDVKTLTQTIERFGKPRGATALFDAVIQATEMLREQKNMRRVIVLVSDGADTMSDKSFDETLRRAIGGDCQIYAVQTGAYDNANLRDLIAERRLQEFAAQTGGAVFVPRSNRDLDDAFAQIAADLAAQYVLHYYVADVPRDGRIRNIAVSVPARPDARIRARKSFFAPKG